jgi:signal transduction histidine kinase
MLRFVMAIFDLSSMRGKITSAYIVLVAVTAVLGIVTYLNLLFLEWQVAEGEVVSDLKDSVLEMRREEKNLFLYADTEALSRADQHATDSLAIIHKYKSTLDEILPNSSLTGTIHSLTTYQYLLRQWDALPTSEKERRQDEIRAIGHHIFVSIEALAKRERRVLETAIQESQWILLISLLVIGLAIYIIGRQLKRVSVTPLKQLESRLMAIADGRFDHLKPPSRDREFRTFTKVFNRMLRELDIRKKRMLQSEKLASIGILASGVAHELNNPLSNISSSCQLLMEELTEGDPEQLRNWLAQIDRETERGRNIVRTLLDFGRQDMFNKIDINLLDLVNETMTILVKTLREYAAELTVDIPDDLTLKLDKQRIQQLLINLIQNAMNAAGDGVHIRICATECNKDPSAIPEDAEVAGNLKCISDYSGRVIRIVVADDGPGIPEENISKVFDPFFTTNEPGRGVGLGLYIVQEIIKEHDGCLAIASKPNEGTQIIMLLPGEELDDE